MDFKSKIKSVQEVKDLTAHKTVILAHGTFDLVHVGHIRHLIYAKTKADVLVVSLTCDNHIAKGNTRPYVPQDLRAMNLAVLGMVDYVIIDENQTPLKNIEILKPDFFAKGFDYSDTLSSKTQEEMKVVKCYGGQMVFTPGDIVYSSSHILSVAPPKLGIEKLLTLMQGEGITFNDLRKSVNSLQGTSVHIVGDTIVDSYTHTSMIGGMTKTPTISVRFEHQKHFVGGAAVVAKHLKAAGADVHFSTLLGNDSFASFVIGDLEKYGVKVKAFTDGRVTTNKNVIIANDYRMLKVDKVENRTVGDDAFKKLRGRIHDIDTEVVIFSDFRHGIFNNSTIPIFIGAIPENCFTAADSQVASRWGNILDFKAFDLITPNEKEARFALGDQDSVLRPLSSKLYKESLCETLILKCGESGTLTTRSSDETDFRGAFALDSFTHRPVDSVGAGDALLAYSSLALQKGHGAVIASILGGIAAGIECEYDGNIPVTSEKVLDHINHLEKVANYDS